MAFLNKLLRFFSLLCMIGLTSFLIFGVYLRLPQQDVLEFDAIIQQACKLPDIDPNDESIQKYVTHNDPIECNGNSTFTYVDGQFIRFNWTVVNTTYKDLQHCTYKPIIRGEENSDGHFEFGIESKPIFFDTRMRDEFVMVDCLDQQNSSIYRNFHSFLIPKRDVDEECAKNLIRYLDTNKPKELLNVLMIGLDSVSRLNSVRQLPKTRKYLVETLGGFEMKGYTKVADNTFVNVVPALTGKFVDELPWDETMKEEPFDKYNFIWKNFTQNGYRTFYGEDAPGIATFTYLKKGFKQPPCHYYNRPFVLAMEEEKSLWNTNHHCLLDKLEADISLDYVRDFVRNYHDKPHFGYFFMTRLTHGGANNAGGADEPHNRFIESLHKENLLNNTVLIYFSDHGMRYGSIRNTYVGKIEERMPMMFLVFPEWFKKKYPSIVRNLKINSNRLTTHFDTYETLKHIVNFQGVFSNTSKSDRGMSLLTEIPQERTCEEAGILPHWCVCLEEQEVDKNSPEVNNASATILSFINDRLSHHKELCAVLKLKDIQTVQAMVANDDVLKFSESVNDVINRTVRFGEKRNSRVIYQLTLVLTPGDGIFEATVYKEQEFDKFLLAGDVSRINKYGEQSSCIDEHEIKKYCFCK